MKGKAREEGSSSERVNGAKVNQESAADEARDDLTRRQEKRRGKRDENDVPDGKMEAKFSLGNCSFATSLSLSLVIQSISSLLLRIRFPCVCLHNSNSA